MLIVVSFTSFFFTHSAKTQTNDEYVNRNQHLSLTFFGTRISSTELQNNISSGIEFIRDASIELKGSFGYGAELEFNPKLYDYGISFYFSVEYMKIFDDELAFRLQEDTLRTAVAMTEKFHMIPFEAGIKWKLPVNLDRFDVYIGGGAGIYTGSRQRVLGYLTSEKVSTKPGFSLNILTGVNFHFFQNIYLNFELKFREGYFESTDRFNSNVITVDGNDFNIENPFTSRLLASGVRISLGLKYNFFK